MEALVGVYAAVVLAAVVAAIVLYRPHVLAFDKKRPGMLQVGFEAAAVSAFGWGLFWLFIQPSPPVWLGAIVVPLPAIGVTAWPAFRTAGTSKTYVVLQAVIASAFFYLPLFVATGLAELLRQPSNEGFSDLLLPAAAAGVGWPIYLAIVLIVAALIRANRLGRLTT